MRRGSRAGGSVRVALGRFGAFGRKPGSLAFGFAFFGALALSGLPRPNHPIFNLPEFERASQDRFFLCIEADDPMFDAKNTREFLRELNPLNVAEVPR